MAEAARMASFPSKKKGLTCSLVAQSRNTMPCQCGGNAAHVSPYLLLSLPLWLIRWGPLLASGERGGQQGRHRSCCLSWPMPGNAACDSPSGILWCHLVLSMPLWLFDEANAALCLPVVVDKDGTCEVVGPCCLSWLFGTPWCGCLL